MIKAICAFAAGFTLAALIGDDAIRSYGVNDGLLVKPLSYALSLLHV
jgi:hypothetical protein